jgi:hypothetical protein
MFAELLHLARALWLETAILLLAGFVLLYRRTYRFKHRPPGQVIAFLRYVDMVELGCLLDPTAEEYLRLNLSKEQFRKEHRNRLWLALEYMGRLFHNALVVVEWAHYEQQRTRRTCGAESPEAWLDLIAACIQVRMCSFALRVVIHFSLLRMAILPFLPVPRVAKLVDKGSRDLLEFYESMRYAAAQLSQSYGDVYREKMVLALYPRAL